MADPLPFLGVALSEVDSPGGEAHDHRPRTDDEGKPIPAHLSCPVCSLHDHNAEGRHPEWCERCHLLGQALFR